MPALAAPAVSLEDCAIVLGVIRSSHVFTSHRGEHLLAGNRGAKRRSGLWAERLVETLAATLDWPEEQVRTCLNFLERKSNRCLRRTRDGRVVAVSPPSQRARAKAVRMGRVVRGLHDAASVVEAGVSVAPGMGGDTEIPAAWRGWDPDTDGAVRTSIPPCGGWGVLGDHAGPWDPAVVDALFGVEPGGEDVLDQSGLTVVPFRAPHALVS